MSSEMTFFVSIYAESKLLEKVTQALSNLKEVDTVYETTGDVDIIALVKVPNINDFRTLLKDEILQISGVKSTVTTVVIYTHKKDGKLVE